MGQREWRRTGRLQICKAQSAIHRGCGSGVVEDARVLAVPEDVEKSIYFSAYRFRYTIRSTVLVTVVQTLFLC